MPGSPPWDQSSSPRPGRPASVRARDAAQKFPSSGAASSLQGVRSGHSQTGFVTCDPHSLAGAEWTKLGQLDMLSWESGLGAGIAESFRVWLGLLHEHLQLYGLWREEAEGDMESRGKRF